MLSKKSQIINPSGPARKPKTYERRENNDIYNDRKTKKNYNDRKHPNVRTEQTRTRWIQSIWLQWSDRFFRWLGREY